MASSYPDKKGRYGKFGGKYVPEVLMPVLDTLENAYHKAIKDKGFQEELKLLLRNFAGRPTPLYFAANLTRKMGGARIYLKREDMAHVGAHKINNTVGQALLAKFMGKQRIIAETGAGMHGVATAAACAMLGLQCVIYMGSVDAERQSLNVFRMRLLGAEVKTVSSGSRTLKDAINEAMRDWITNVSTTYYLIGSVVGPHPYPMIVRDFQSIIGRETKRQILDAEGRLPDAVIACVGGGSNAMGAFHSFMKDRAVKLIGVEAAGEGLSSKKHAASIAGGEEGVLHGSLSYVLQNKFGQISETHSVSAGLDYPGVGPEHAYLASVKRATYVGISDKEAVEAFYTLSRIEGIIPALESSHAIAYATKLAKSIGKNKIIVVCLSGRGDKDIGIVQEYSKRH